MSESIARRVKGILIGSARDLGDRRVFHRVSLIALFAWVGLGADGLSSSCYGPEEAFKALGEYRHLSVFIALAAVATVLIISASYSQIIELFPTGGGGYLVASKLLSPTTGAVAGCALVIDYVLTIAISIASGTDALFSLMPPEWHAWKMATAFGGIGVLLLLNLRGVKESVMPLVPVFFLFLLTHAVVVTAAVAARSGDAGEAMHAASDELQRAHAQLGVAGILLLLLRAYSTGAGTYTGIEAVSNGLPILREPRVETGRRTMRYMAISLAATVAGLLLAYVLVDVTPVEGQTLNAVLVEQVTQGWPSGLGYGIVTLTLVSEAALLLIAAQAGFIDGPRVLASMALDRWVPTRFALLSDRLVNQNGILLMGAAAGVVVWLTGGSVGLLVVLYSVNVFITFTLSQVGMVRHWWSVRRTNRAWKRRIALNGTGAALTASILVSMLVVKFHDGGWITLCCTAIAVALAFLVRRHYGKTRALLRRLDEQAAGLSIVDAAPRPVKAVGAGTAIILVSGFNGLGLHTLMNVVRQFGATLGDYVFLSVGVVDAGTFKGADELEHLRRHTQEEASKYAKLVEGLGCRAEVMTELGTDAVDTIELLADQAAQRYPGATFFAGQLVFHRDTWLTRLLHNAVVYAVQQRLFRSGRSLVIVPIRV
jgi:amino acid transporter